MLFVEIEARIVSVDEVEAAHHAAYPSLDQNLHSERYAILRIADWKRLIREIVTPRNLYEEDLRDCNAYSRRFRSQCEWLWRVNGCFMLVDLGVGHTYCSLLVDRGGGKPIHCRIYDPVAGCWGIKGQDNWRCESGYLC